MSEDSARIRELEQEVENLRRELSSLRADPPPPSLGGFDSLLGDRSMLEQLPDIVLLMARDHRILYLNRTLPGRSAVDMLGTSALDYVQEDQRASYQERLERSWSTGVVCSFEVTTISGASWESRFAPIRLDGETRCMLCTARDITPRRRSEVALRESEHRLRLALDATGMGIWTWAADTDRLVWDRTACAILGLPESDAHSTGRDFIALVHPEDRDRVREAISRSLDTGQFDEIEHRVVLHSGQLRQISTRGTIIRNERGDLLGFRGGVIDVTARKRFEQQLSHGQKMEAIGQLTAGIAHNFNNLLSVIVPNVGLARHSQGADLLSCLDDIDHAARRATDLVQQLTLFTRQNTDQRRDSIDLTALVQRTVQICRSTFQRVIRIELEIIDERLRVAANAGQIEQVLLNICINARDALLDGAIERPNILLRVDRNDRFARVRVIDNGPGMDEAVRVRVFEPFFTTKPIGRGTGLGLASAYAIVTDHKGRVTCESRLGAGAVLTVELPLASTSKQTTGAHSFNEGANPARGSAECVLIADGDTLPRRALASMLAFGGYRVLEAGAADQLLGYFPADQACDVDLVLLDASLPLPALTHEQLIAKLARRGNPVPVVLLHAATSLRESSARATGGLFKPIDANTLFGTIRAVLDSRPK